MSSLRDLIKRILYWTDLGISDGVSAQFDDCEVTFAFENMDKREHRLAEQTHR